jgi:LPXTG-motif cell wall-anchored protein
MVAILFGEFLHTRYCLPFDLGPARIDLLDHDAGSILPIIGLMSLLAGVSMLFIRRRRFGE